MSTVSVSQLQGTDEMNEDARAFRWKLY